MGKRLNPEWLITGPGGADQRRLFGPLLSLHAPWYRTFDGCPSCWLYSLYYPPFYP